MDKTEFLYQMYYKDNGTDVVFYIGKTIDPDNRLKQHKGCIKDGTEDKYVFIRELEEKGIKWDLKTFKEIPAGTHVPDYEHYYVIKYFKEGHPLTNMKHGDLQKVLGDDWKTTEFRSVDDVKTKRIEVEKVKNLVKNHKSKRLEYKILVEEIDASKRKKDRDLTYCCNSIRYKKEKLQKLMEYSNRHSDLYDDETTIKIKKLAPRLINKIKELEKDLKTVKKTSDDEIAKLENKRADILVNFYIDNVELINAHDQIIEMAKNYCWQTIEKFLLMLLNKNFKSWEKAINDYKWNKTNISMKHIFIGKL